MGKFAVFPSISEANSPLRSECQGKTPLSAQSSEYDNSKVVGCVESCTSVESWGEALLLPAASKSLCSLVFAPSQLCYYDGGFVRKKVTCWGRRGSPSRVRVPTKLDFEVTGDSKEGVSIALRGEIQLLSFWNFELLAQCRLQRIFIFSVRFVENFMLPYFQKSNGNDLGDAGAS